MVFTVIKAAQPQKKKKNLKYFTAKEEYGYIGELWNNCLFNVDLNKLERELHQR